MIGSGPGHLDARDEDEPAPRHLPDVVMLGSGLRQPWDLGPGPLERAEIRKPGKDQGGHSPG